jgi:hypothetical protein
MKSALFAGSLFAACILSACSAIPQGTTPLPQIVTGYCALPVPDRALNRAVINSLLLPNSVAITCAADSGK